MSEFTKEEIISMFEEENVQYMNHGGSWYANLVQQALSEGRLSQEEVDNILEDLEAGRLTVEDL